MKIHGSMGEAKKQKTACGAQKDPLEAQIENSLSKIKNKIFVMSGKGGVGKSSVATNLAASLLKKGYRVGLMDVDLHGPSIAHMTGLTENIGATEEKKLIPIDCHNGLKVVSMQSLMQDKDQAIIWRGPAKTGIIKQFIGMVKWDDLDFLVIDAPPGTGDEPITVAQSIKDAKAVIVTTPQKVALSDVRKSINFCKTVKMDILGVIENMASLLCPHCGKEIELFKSGGGKNMAEEMQVNFLGQIPFDQQVVIACDAGEPIALKNDSLFADALEICTTKILDALK